jgi:hypothetical protein
MTSPVSAGDAVYAVLSPLGERAVERVPLAPRLDTLAGKTIGAVWNGGFRGDETFPILERMLRDRYPGVRLIPYTEFPLTTIASFHPETKAETLAAVRAALKEKGCDAVITGNGA